MKSIIIEISYDGDDLTTNDILVALQSSLSQSVVYVVEKRELPEGAEWKKGSDFLKENPKYRLGRGDLKWQQKQNE